MYWTNYDAHASRDCKAASPSCLSSAAFRIQEKAVDKSASSPLPKFLYKACNVLIQCNPSQDNTFWATGRTCHEGMYTTYIQDFFSNNHNMCHMSLLMSSMCHEQMHVITRNVSTRDNGVMHSPSHRAEGVWPCTCCIDCSSCLFKGKCHSPLSLAPAFKMS